MRKKYRELGLKGIPSLAPMGMDALMAYEWPGNVRELENAVERAMILYDGRHLCFDDLGVPGTAERRPLSPPAPSGPYRLDDVMAAHIRKAMETAGGRVEGRGGAAELLGVKPGTLRHRMRKMGIPFGRTVDYPN